MSGPSIQDTDSHDAAGTGEVPPPEIERESFSRFLATLLEGPVRIVALEGSEGAGKTTLLRQFARERATQTCAVFITPASRWAYHPIQVAADLCDQIHRKLTGTALPPTQVVDEAFLQRNVNALARKARHEERLYYFVLDGLADLPESDDSTRQQILDLLPFGIEFFRFIISGDAEKLPLSPAARRTVKSYPLAFFTREESERYLAGLALEKAQLAEIYDLTDGIPAKLASVRRILVGANDPSAQIARLPEALRELFRVEWNAVDRSDDLQRLTLGILAYENRAYSVDELAAILAVPSTVIQEKLGGLRFLKYDTTGVVQFDSESYRKFAAEELGALRTRINDLFVDFYQRKPDSDEALTSLSSLLLRADRLPDLVQYLSPERFARLYQRAPSLRLVQEKAEQGIFAARSLSRDADLVRFTVQKCTIGELARSEIAVSEIRARTALGDYESAFALAEAANRVEVRFRLLVAVARARREAGLSDDPVLQERIRALFEQLEPDALGAQTFAAASDLFYTAPDLAIELVSREAGGGGGENALDWALARLAIQAHLIEKDPNASKRAWEIAERIQDPTAKRFSTEVSFILGSLTAAQAIAESEKLAVTSDRLYVLQQWMHSNRDRDDAADVLEYGLMLSLRATGYTADARVCRELALCLPYIKEVHRVSYFTSLIDGQRTVLERLGPTEEFVRLQLLLARAEWQHDRAAATARLADMYNLVASLNDAVVKTATLARFAAALARLDPDRSLDHGIGIHQLVDQELQDGVAHLLSMTARHEEVLEGVIHALALRKPELCLGIVERMNAEWRRDLAYREFAEALAGMPVSEIDVGTLGAAFQRIIDNRVHDATLYNFIYGLGRRRIAPSAVERFWPVLARVSEMRTAALRAEAAAIAVRLLGQCDTERMATRRSEVLRVVRDSWNTLDDDWQKVTAGFSLVADIAEAEPGMAAEIVQQLNDLKGRLALQDQEAAGAARLGMRLAIRAFGGLMARDFDAEEDLDRLLSAITQCGGIEDQADLLTELALRCRLAKRQVECSRIVERKLVPLLYSVSEHDAGRKWELLRRTAAALYAGAANTAGALLADLPDVVRDEALSGIVWSILTKVPTGDAYDGGAKSGYDISFEDANAVVALMAQMTNDSLVYSFIEALADSAAGAAYRNNLNRRQRADLVRQLEELAAQKFPNERFIRHDGYLIVARAQINRLREREDSAAIEDLLDAAGRIPNLSDRAYVTAIVASTCRGIRERRSHFEKARDVADAIPVLEERIDRYLAISMLASSADAAFSRELLKGALVLCSSGEGASLEDRRKSLIDLAYRLDPAFASSLVASADDDPAKQLMDRQLRLYRLRDALAERRSREDDLRVRADVEVSRAAWMKLGALNANRLAAAPTERALPMLEFAARQPLSLAYPIFAWFTQNAIRRTGNTGTLREYVLPLYEAYLRGAELAILANARTSAQSSRALAFVATPLGSGQAVLIGDGEREEGINQLREWLRSHMPKSLRIMEPYFGPNDVMLLALVREIVEDCEVLVVAGRRESLSNVAAPYEQAYRDAWNRFSVGDPPPSTVIFAGARSTGKFPVHDRWWLTENAGVHLGTSYNGIGSRVSTVRPLDAEEATRKLTELTPYFTQARSDFEGERLAYLSFTL